jgi:ankyrin repeat protein
VSISALWASIKKSRADDVKRLLDSGVSVLTTDEHRNTLVHIAAEAGKLEILRLLKDRGAPLDRLNWINQTPLSLAARSGHFEVVKYLCENGATTHGPDLNTAPLGAAAAAGHLAIVKYLVEQRNVPLNALERPFGATPLFVAARFLRLDVVRYLMEKGADPTIANTRGEAATGLVEHLIQGQPNKPTSPEATPCNDFLECRGDPSGKSRRASPPSGAGKGTQGLLSHLIKPKKEWHFWQ